MKNSHIRFFLAFTIIFMIVLTRQSSAQSTVANWSFPNTSADAVVDAAIAANAASNISSYSWWTPLTISYANTGAGGGIDKCATVTDWSAGTGNVYWSVTISTLGYYSMELSSKQSSSGTGPRDFKVVYQVGSGSWLDLPGASTIVCTTAFSAAGTGSINNIVLPSSCDNQSSITLRWILTSNTAQNGGAIASSGTSKIDDIMIKGNSGTFYRSLATANWSTAASWQSSADNITWATATVAPDNTSNFITVRNGHTITVNSAVTADQITVDVGGTLYYKSNTLTLNDGSGVDLLVNGTFIDSSATNLVWSGSSTWQMGSNGTYIKLHNSSATTWQNNYQGGILTIPSTSNWIIRKVSTVVPALVSNGGVYPNLTFESRSGTWGVTSTNNFSATGGFPTILGNLDIGGTTSTQAVALINDCSNSLIPVAGNVTIRLGSSFAIGGATNGAVGLDIKGNLIVDGTLSHSNASFTNLSRTIQFSGTGSQSISGSGSITSINTLVLNNASSDVTLSKPLPISSTITFTNGNLITTAVNLPTLANGATVTGASNNSYVDGPIAVTFTANATFTFPTGSAGYYRPIALSGMAGTGTSVFTAEHFNTGPNQASPVMSETSVGTGIHHVSAIEYWKLAKTGTRTARINIGWTAPYNASDVTNLLTLRLASWDGSIWQDVAATTAGTVSSGSLTSSAAPTNYIAFSLASNLGDNPLPITLVEFIGKPMPIGNVLDWTSSSEKNNDHFSVERSQDMQHFEAIGEVKGNGSTEALSHYRFTDKHPLAGINYYRLRQFDFDGSNALSNIIAIDAKSAVKTYTLANDAANQQLLLRLQASESIGEVTIIDLLGRKRMSQILAAGQEECGISCSQLEHGVYFLLIQHDGETQVQKFFY